MREKPNLSAPVCSVAIVGSGPAALFACERLKRVENLAIDVLEALPFPFGLVRYGVAPDHQGVKNIQRQFQRHLEADTVRFVGGVRVGEHISLAELRELYDAVVLGVGGSVSRKFGIAGEDLPQVWTSDRFAGWYNAHPSYTEAPPLRAGGRTLVLGHGNVAVDVARVLLRKPDDFAGSDLSQQAGELLTASPQSGVVLAGRSGAAEAKCTTPELRELLKLDGVQVRLEGADSNAEALQSLVAEQDQDAATLPAEVRRRKGNLQSFLEVAEVAEGTEATAPNKRELVWAFGYRPVAFVEREGKLAAVRFALRIRKADGAWQDTGEELELPCDFAVSCIGYVTPPLEGVPYDAARGIFVNQDGRIDSGLWAVGWCGRGPTGAIATNRKESHARMEALLSELPATPSDKAGAKGLDRLLTERGVRSYSLDDWRVIEKAEAESASEDRIREKFISLDAVRALLDVTP